VKSGKQSHSEVYHFHGFADHNRFSSKSGEPMPLAPVVLLYPVSLIFAYIMFAGPVALSVNSIAIRKDKTDFPLI
jgi:hypothetical protein